MAENTFLFNMRTKVSQLQGRNYEGTNNEYEFIYNEDYETYLEEVRRLRKFRILNLKTREQAEKEYTEKQEKISNYIKSESKSSFIDKKPPLRVISFEKSSLKTNLRQILENGLSRFSDIDTYKLTIRNDAYNNIYINVHYSFHIIFKEEYYKIGTIDGRDISIDGIGISLFFDRFFADLILKHGKSSNAIHIVMNGSSIFNFYLRSNTIKDDGRRRVLFDESIYDEMNNQFYNAFIR